MSAHPSPAQMEEVSLLDLVDTALDKGVVVCGDATLSVADVDLVFLGLKLVLASVETMDSWRRSSGCRLEGGGNHPNGQSQHARTVPLPPLHAREGAGAPLATLSPAPAERADQRRRPLPRLSPEPDELEHGLAKLVLTVVELLRQLLERQAIRRMDGDSLRTEDVERMGLAFQRLEGKMEELKRVFGLEQEDLNLDLGPLGNLM